MSIETDALWQVVKSLQTTASHLGDFTNKLMARTDKLKIKTDGDTISDLREKLKRAHHSNATLRGQKNALQLQIKELERALKVS